MQKRKENKSNGKQNLQQEKENIEINSILKCPVCGQIANLHFKKTECLGCDKCHTRSLRDWE